MKNLRRYSGFTLIELLVVIAIIGILAAIAMPTLSRFRAGDTLAAGVRQIQDDVARARQYAISQRTTVYMVFCPSNFWADSFRVGGPDRYASLSSADKDLAAKLYGKQLNSYAFVALRRVGDQPGQQTPQFLSKWMSLPEGVIIPQFKFLPRTAYTRIVDYSVSPNLNYDVYGFAVTNTVPFPAESTTQAVAHVSLPYIAFNHMGQLTYDGLNPASETDPGIEEYIPVARGSISFARDVNKAPTQTAPSVAEAPPGNSTNNFILVRIDKLTGRARVEKQEFR